MRLGAGTLEQEIGNQSLTFLLNGHGPTEDHSPAASLANVLWQVAGKTLPALLLRFVSAPLKMKTKPLDDVGTDRNYSMYASQRQRGRERGLRFSTEGCCVMLCVVETWPLRLDQGKG